MAVEQIAVVRCNTEEMPCKAEIYGEGKRDASDRARKEGWTFANRGRYAYCPVHAPNVTVPKSQLVQLLKEQQASSLSSNGKAAYQALCDTVGLAVFSLDE